MHLVPVVQGPYPAGTPSLLTTLTLENWKSFGQATLYVDPLTVLIGTNASGKSNLLDALAFLNRVANGVSLTAALRGDGALTPLRGGVEWAARKPGTRFAIATIIRADAEWDYHYRLECVATQGRCDLVSERLEHIRYDIEGSGVRGKEVERVPLFWSEPTTQSTREMMTVAFHIPGRRKPLSPSRVMAQLGSRSGVALFQLTSHGLIPETQDGSNAVISALQSIFILDPIPSHMRGFTLLSDRLDTDGGNIAGVLAALPGDRREAIEKKLTEYASRLPERDIVRVYAETVGKLNTDAMLYCEEAFGDAGEPSTVDARGMSDGTLRFLAILTALLTRPEGSLLVVEEVDNGLHPSRSRVLLDMLNTIGRERNIDVIVTTHDPALLDAMGTEMVPYITVVHRDPANGTSCLTLLEDITQLPKLLAQGQVGRLSSQGLIEAALKAQSAGAG